MGSPCEVICETDSESDARRIGELVAQEAWRVEDKFSRYIPGNIVDQVNTAAGQPITVDQETARLLDFSTTLFEMSEGAFDITSGVLRRAWTFDGGDRVPAQADVQKLVALVGWDKASWSPPNLTLPGDMQVDLGGIGKEYAVDRAVLLLRDSYEIPCLVNFGGDLAVTMAPRKRDAWSVAIETLGNSETATRIELRQGALATSGNTRRFIEKNGVRYSHVLDARSGWPVRDAAASITVAAETCTQAGMLATLAILKGLSAEAFLAHEDKQFWCYRGNDA